MSPSAKERPSRRGAGQAGAPDLGRLSINHYVCPPGYPLAQFVGLVAGLGAGAVALTRRAVDEIEPRSLRRLLDDHGLAVSSLSSVGFFLYGDEARAAAQRDANARLIEAAAELDAGTLVVITGGLEHGDWTLEGARARVEAGCGELARRAGAAGVRLGLEPIHPVDVRAKGVVNTIADALSIAAPHDGLGLTLDLFHSWWDRDLWTVFERAPAKVFLCQVCNVVEPSPDKRPERELLADGTLDVGAFLDHARARGYDGFFEFELFAHHLRGRAVENVIESAVAQYRALA